MEKTNQQKLNTLWNYVGPGLFDQLLTDLGPGTVYIPKDVRAARREVRNTAIRAKFYSDDFRGREREDCYRVLGQEYGLKPDTIRKIINQTTSGSR